MKYIVSAVFEVGDKSRLMHSEIFAPSEQSALKVAMVVFGKSMLLEGVKAKKPLAINITQAINSKKERLWKEKHRSILSFLSKKSENLQEQKENLLESEEYLTQTTEKQGQQEPDGLMANIQLPKI